jgi:hypothetical protein|tara:strand:+ start:230 stop:379 length:150 start_codon:yes stop_codon:yes gene_type:complete
MTSPTPQITGGKKQSEERTALIAVRVHLPCYAIALRMFLAKENLSIVGG